MKNLKKIKYVVSEQYIPYQNLAWEEYLLNTVADDECILYLWQNEKTVVVGKNQNAWKECHLNNLDADNGYLVRRLSGGGAVFHDLGNLNFTFLVQSKNYDVDQQLNVILEATRALGLNTIKQGRNDLTVEGRKFSGNAFYKTGNRQYHHGTILLDVDKNQVAKYLNVSQNKLKLKGVDSVKSRIANLKEFNSDINISMMQDELIKAFAKTYNLEPEKLNLETLEAKEQEKIANLKYKFASKRWRLGEQFAFDIEFGKAYKWGEISINLKVKAGKIQNIKIYTDALDTDFILRYEEALLNCDLNSNNMIKVINNIRVESELEKTIKKDIIELVKEQEL